MAKQKKLTLDRMFKNFIKELDYTNPLVLVVAVERMQTIADLTEQAMKENPEAFNLVFLPPPAWTTYIDLVRKHFPKDTAPTDLAPPSTSEPKDENYKWLITGGMLGTESEKTNILPDYMMEDEEFKQWAETANTHDTYYYEATLQRVTCLKNYGKKPTPTYDVVFHDPNNSMNKGFEQSIEQCKHYIKTYNGTNESYFADFKGGTVQVVNTTTFEVVHEEPIR